MDEKGLIEDEEGKSGTGTGSAEGFEGYSEKGSTPAKSRLGLLLGIGVLLVVGGYAAMTFLLKQEEEPVSPPPARIPINAAPAMTDTAGTKATAPKEEGKVEAKTEGVTLIIGTYATEYEVKSAERRLKGLGIDQSSREVRKRVVMNRMLVNEVEDKGEAERVIADLDSKGYDPFSLLRKGKYRVYAVSNLNEDISRRNKTELEKLGYTPTVEKKSTPVKVYELITKVKSEAEVEALSAKLGKMGFKPEKVKN